MLGDSVDVYLDAGPTAGAVPSTIVDATTEVLIVRRQGVVDYEALRAVVPTIEVAEPG
jgi:tRNA A37 threonylcarbamoyladenosine synthetase subunit TsaC/SUA5/YrdC